MTLDQSLAELDREYRELSSGPVENRIAYCTKLVNDMERRLREEPGDTSLKELLSEIILAAQKELASLGFMQSSGQQ